MKIKLDNEIPTRIYFWNKERGLLLNPPSFRLELSLLLEEISEYYRTSDIEQEVDALADMTVFAFGWLAKLNDKTRDIILDPENFIEDDIIGLVYDISRFYDCGLRDDAIDATYKLIVNALNGVFNRGYHPTIIMEEVVKHIESRVGSIDENGKWVKDKTAIVYQPNFKRALIAPEVIQ